MVLIKVNHKVLVCYFSTGSVRRKLVSIVFMLVSIIVFQASSRSAIEVEPLGGVGKLEVPGKLHLI